MWCKVTNGVVQLLPRDSSGAACVESRWQLVSHPAEILHFSIWRTACGKAHAGDYGEAEEWGVISAILGFYHQATGIFRHCWTAATPHTQMPTVIWRRIIRIPAWCTWAFLQADLLWSNLQCLVHHPIKVWSTWISNVSSFRESAAALKAFALWVWRRSWQPWLLSMAMTWMLYNWKCNCAPSKASFQQAVTSKTS